jgi:hypothetical protein
VGSSEHSNKLSGPMKRGESFEQRVTASFFSTHSMESVG